VCLTRCHELHQTTVATSKKTETAVRLSEEDQAQILNLTRDVEKTWAAVESSHMQVPALVCRKILRAEHT